MPAPLFVHAPSVRTFASATLSALVVVLMAFTTSGCEGEVDRPSPEGEPSAEPGGTPETEPEDGPPSLALELCMRHSVSLEVYAQGFANLFDNRRYCEQRWEAGPSDAEARELCEGRPDILGVFEEAVSGGRVIIDKAKFDACLDAARSIREGGERVQQFQEGGGELYALVDDPDCTGAFTGTRNENEECVQPWDCAGELLCEASPPDDPTTRCLPPATEDQRCGGSRTCAEGLTCLAGRCEAPVALGRPCVSGGPPCVEGSACELTSSEPIEVYTCVAFIEEGGACTNEDRCEEDTVCENGVCTRVVNPADGESCTVGGPACEAECSVCRPSTPLGPTTCQPRGDSGDACGQTDDCLVAFYCAVDTNTCTPVRQDGDVCNDDEPCGDGLHCYDGSCRPLGDTDAECGLDSDCLDSHYCFNGNVCRPRGGPGANCNSTTPCAEDYECLDTVCSAGRQGDACRVADPNCEFGLACVVAGSDCPPNDAQCIQDNPQGTCEVPPGTGEECAGKFNVCDDDNYCPDQDICAPKLEAGVECEVGDHCASGLCLESGTCATTTPSCLASQGSGLVMMLFGTVFPLLLIRRRRRREGEVSASA